MLAYKETFVDDSTIAIWKIEENERELLEKFDLLRSKYEKEIEQFTSQKRKLEFLSVRALLKDLIGEANYICYNTDNKPSLLDNKLRISISHTNGYASIILHSQNIVGIDIEEKRDKIFRIKHKFLKYEELQNINSTNSRDHLLLHWSTKEAVYKMMNEPSIDFLEEIHIKPFPLAESGFIQAFETKTKNSIHFNLQYKIFNDFVLVWGSPKTI